jgi:AcrR family transcriptional regulator
LLLDEFRVTISDMKRDGARQYEMTARAASAELTAGRILDSAVALFWAKPSDQISLEDIADLSGVTARTVIRRFGSKDGVIEAAAAREMARTRDQREVPDGAGVEVAVAVLLEHYEEVGDQVLAMLAAEQTIPGLRAIADQGRQLHSDWCRRTFADALSGLSPSERKRRLAQLVAVCDVYTWKLLRRQSGLSVRQTQIALTEILLPLLERS